MGSGIKRVQEKESSVKKLMKNTYHAVLIVKRKEKNRLCVRRQRKLCTQCTNHKLLQRSDRDIR